MEQEKQGLLEIKTKSLKKSKYTYCSSEKMQSVRNIIDIKRKRKLRQSITNEKKK